MKRGLIISASSGIGTALVEALNDYELTLAGRNARTLQGLSGQAVPTDTASELEVEALFADLPPLSWVRSLRRGQSGRCRARQSGGSRIHNTERR